MFSLSAVPGWALAAPSGVTFPHDFGAHPATRTEWWYLTGSLEAGPGGPPGTWGFQVTFFRSRTGIDAAHPSRFAASELVFGHAALTDLGAGRQFHDQRVARAGFGAAEAATGRTAIVLRDWRLERSGPPEQGRYTTRVASPAAGFTLDLTLETTQPPLVQGDHGLSRKGSDASHFTHYYSEPQLAVRGALTRGGRPVAVTGRAWLDHEWGDALMSDDVMGWDWTGMNLDDGSALTAFRLRRADGSTAYAGGSLRPPGGATRVFGPDEVVFKPGRTWRSPASQATYPVDWTVDTPAGRHRVQALLDAQELDSRASTGAWYWEGLSDLRDAAGARVGRGYLEMTGYASRLRL